MTTLTELLTWHDATQRMPDDDTTVLLWVEYSDGEQDWCAGWRDGDVWRDASSAMPVRAEVTHWAEPSGPKGGELLAPPPAALKE